MLQRQMVEMIILVTVNWIKYSTTKQSLRRQQMYFSTSSTTIVLKQLMTSYPVSAYMSQIYLYRSSLLLVRKNSFSAHKIIMEEIIDISCIHSDLDLILLSRNCHSILLLLHGQCPCGQSKRCSTEANRWKRVACFRLLQRYRKQGVPRKAKLNR